MNNQFRISGVIYFFIIIIPQNSNSPIPRMDFWLRKEQDDGFIDRDMTSSLTGDESFGSAHRSYENSLVRKEIGDRSGGMNVQLTADSQNSVDGDRHLRDERVRRGNQGGNKKSSYELRNSIGELPADEEKIASLQGEGLQESEDDHNSKFLRKKFNFEKLKSDFLDNLYGQVSNLENGNELSQKKNGPAFRKVSAMDPIDESSVSCTKKKDAPSITLGKMEVLKLESPLRKKISNSLQSQMKSSLRKRDQLDIKKVPTIEDSLKKDENIKDSSEIALKEEEDYDNSNSRGDLMEKEEEEDEEDEEDDEDDGGLETDDDYSQLKGHDVMFKREENKERNSDRSNKDKEKEKEKEGSNKEIGADSGKLKDTKSEVVSVDSGQEKNPQTSVDKETVERGSKTNFENNEMGYDRNSDPGTKEVNEPLRGSSKAAQDVNLFQQKLTERSSDNNVGEAKAEEALSGNKEGKNTLHDVRSKREDEDEQKNMKTGTDEGGGEYEDDEGKGHNDEEEYYEEANYSEKGEENSENLADSEVKNVKREANKVNEHKNQEDDLENEDEDDDEENENSEGIQESSEEELSLKNAPVENSESANNRFKSDGEKNNKKISRKDVKIWDQWGEWSPCSVTCGVGRMTRWKHCIGGGCLKGEKKARIKKCIKPAC